MNVIIAGFVPTWFFVGAVILPILWLVSEFKGTRWQRITLGIVSLMIITVTVSETRLIIPTYTEHFLHSSVLRARQLLKDGQSDYVQRCFDSYGRATADSDRYYRPAMDLSRDLYKETTNSSNNAVEPTRGSP